jgi:DNA polymerase sigma
MNSFNKAGEAFMKESDKIVDKVTKTSKLLSNESLYEQISEDIKAMAVFRGKKGVEVNFFGSRFIGLGTKASDLDIFIKVGNDEFVKTAKSKSDFASYEKAFMNHGDWLVERTVPTASVPIIACIYLPLRLNCE